MTRRAKKLQRKRWPQGKPLPRFQSYEDELAFWDEWAVPWNDKVGEAVEGPAVDDRMPHMVIGLELPEWVDRLEDRRLFATVLDALVARHYAKRWGALCHKRHVRAFYAADYALESIRLGHVMGRSAQRMADEALRKFNAVGERAHWTKAGMRAQEDAIDHQAAEEARREGGRNLSHVEVGRRLGLVPRTPRRHVGARVS